MCESPRGAGGVLPRWLAGSLAVRFGLGEAGALQILNPTDQPVRFLALSSNGRPDIVVRPDAGTIGVAERLPDGGGLRLYFKREDQVAYWDGEGDPEPS